MRDTPRVSNGQTSMNQIAERELAKLGFSWNNAYSFYRNSCLISQISLGHNGVSLSADERAIQELEPVPSRAIFPLTYSSHNVDNPSQAHALMRLFDKWMFYTSILSRAS